MMKDLLNLVWNLALFLLMILCGTYFAIPVFVNILPFYIVILFLTNTLFSGLVVISLFVFSTEDKNAEPTIKSVLKTKARPTLQAFISFVYIVMVFVLAGYQHYVLATLLLIVLIEKLVQYSISVAIRDKVVAAGFVLGQNGNVQRVVAGATTNLKEV